MFVIDRIAHSAHAQRSSGDRIDNAGLSQTIDSVLFALRSRDQRFTVRSALLTSRIRLVACRITTKSSR